MISISLDAPSFMYSNVNICCLLLKLPLLVFLRLNCLQVLNIFYDWPVKYYFDNFGIWLLGYRIEFSCLYIPQGHNFINTLRLWSTNEYVIYFDFERNSTFKKDMLFSWGCKTFWPKAWTMMSWYFPFCMQYLKNKYDKAYYYTKQYL